MLRAAVIAVLFAAIAGCSHNDNTLMPSNGPPPPGTPTLNINPKGTMANNPNANNPSATSPVVSKLFANNPPAGKPNHLSPEMQAEIEHYRTVGGSAPNR